MMRRYARSRLPRAGNSFLRLAIILMAGARSANETIEQLSCWYVEHLSSSACNGRAKSWVSPFLRALSGICARSSEMRLFDLGMETDEGVGIGFSGGLILESHDFRGQVRTLRLHGERKAWICFNVVRSKNSRTSATFFLVAVMDSCPISF